jgi:hypothetical protein
MVAHLTRIYQGELARTRTAVSQGVARAWNSLPDYNRGNVDTFLHRALPIVKAGQTRAVGLTGAYLSRHLSVPPLGLNPKDLTGAAVRNGTDPSVVYTRPFIQMWASLAKNGDFQQALQTGLSRAEASAEMDIALSMTHAVLAYGQQSSEEIVGWRRVADGGACPFCSEIDGATTGPDEPMPLHDRCGCTVDPITRWTMTTEDAPTTDPGDVVGDTEIAMHGELGPLIVRKGDAFTTEADF